MRACCTNAYVNDVHTEHKHKNKKKAYAYVAAVLTNISINIRLIFMLTLALISLGCHAKIVMQRIPTAAKETRIGLYAFSKHGSIWRSIICAGVFVVGLNFELVFTRYVAMFTRRLRKLLKNWKTYTMNGSAS